MPNKCALSPSFCAKVCCRWPPVCLLIKMVIMLPIPILIMHGLLAIATASEYGDQCVCSSPRKTFAYTVTLIARFMGPIWGPSGADRTQVGPMLAPWTLLSGKLCVNREIYLVVYQAFSDARHPILQSFPGWWARYNWNTLLTSVYILKYILI